MNKRKNIKDIYLLKNKRKIVSISCGVSSLAKIADNHVDIILVGDSIGMTIYGLDNTLKVTLQMIINHGKAIVNSTIKSFIVLDMPFGTYEQSKEKAFANASKLLSKTGAQAIKLEGGQELGDTIKYLSNRGIPVMGHVGLMPQRINISGGFATQGKTDISSKKIINDAKFLTTSGAFSIVLEAIPEKLGKIITSEISIPTIGIGGGRYCDGQILVLEDLLGIDKSFNPKYLKKYANINDVIEKAVFNYSIDVKKGSFPKKTNTY